MGLRYGLRQIKALLGTYGASIIHINDIHGMHVRVLKV